ncbi:hypothetical protein Ancab_034641 [Ancistrocladus abbreviatus]
MASGSLSQAIVSVANPSSYLFNNGHRQAKAFWRTHTDSFRIRATSEDSDCNVEECAPDKEPAVYLAESAISSGVAGPSSEGSQKTAAIATSVALISVAAASLVLLQVGKTPPRMQTMEYSGPSLSYYINKFKPPEIIQASVPTQSENSLTSQSESSVPQVSAFEVESRYQLEPSTLGVNNAS